MAFGGKSDLSGSRMRDYYTFESSSQFRQGLLLNHFLRETISFHKQCKTHYCFSVIGEGSFGNVYLVRRISDGQLYALKKV